MFHRILQNTSVFHSTWLMLLEGVGPVEVIAVRLEETGSLGESTAPLFGKRT
jgi:hypothetical protein